MEFRLRVDPSFPFVKIIETDNSEFWLTQFRSEGILKDRVGLVRLMFKMFQTIFQCIKQSYQLNREGVETILVLRDAIVAFEPALLAFPNSSIGLIGHERNTSTIPPTTEISFKRYEKPTLFQTVIVIDPMVATGGTLIEVIKELTVGGRPHSLILGCILITRQAASRLEGKVDEIFAFSLEKGLMKAAWLVPGLRGVKDLGDIIFGTHLDWKQV